MGPKREAEIIGFTASPCKESDKSVDAFRRVLEVRGFGLESFRFGMAKNEVIM
jgi:hypothetical protein